MGRRRANLAAILGVTAMLATIALTSIASWPQGGTVRWIAVGCGATASFALLGFTTAVTRERERLGAALYAARRRLPAEVLVELDLQTPLISYPVASEEPRLLR